MTQTDNARVRGEAVRRTAWDRDRDPAMGTVDNPLPMGPRESRSTADRLNAEIMSDG